MSLLIYNIVTGAYFWAIKLAAVFNGKAKKWVGGRKGIFNKLEKEFKFENNNLGKIVWMHCASLGEFEQGRTILESLKKERPEIKILLTFFSPSGYEIRKDYKAADWIYYLPADSKKNASRFIETIKPSLVIFVKYEFWFHYLAQLKKRNIPIYLIAAVFRKDQVFFKWYGGLHRDMLYCFNKIFVQEEASAKLLRSVGFENIKIAGDTRVDRVLEIAAGAKEFPLVRKFSGAAPVLVCGSTWPKDEQAIKTFYNDPASANWKFIVAPHDISEKRITGVEMLFGGQARRFSVLKKEAENESAGTRVLIIDNIGMLSALYQYGRIAYVGGGFGTGIHNTLEPMAFHLPVIYGPAYGKFIEAKKMVNAGGHFSISSPNEFIETVKKLLVSVNYKSASDAVARYMEGAKGSTKIILEEI